MTWSDGRCDYCDRHPPGYAPWLHSDWVHNANGSRNFDQPFPFTDEETQIREDAEAQLSRQRNPQGA